MRTTSPGFKSKIMLVVAVAVLAAASTAAAIAGTSRDRMVVPFDLSDQRPSLQRRLLEQSLPLRAAPAYDQQEMRMAGVKAPAVLRAAAIMVEFADSCFYGRQDLFPGPLPTSTQSSFYYSAHDELYYTHLLQDVQDYYQAVSGGRFTFDFMVHDRVIALDRTMGHYGNHPEFGEQPFALAADAIATLVDEIDLSQYGTVILIHAGAGQETDILNNSPEQIYSTYLGPAAFQRAVDDSILSQPYLLCGSATPDTVRHVLVLPETQFQDSFDGFSGQYGSLGTYCFVVGLRLGMLSLSDFTPAGSPDSQGVGQFCLMGYGLFTAGGYIPPHPCAFNKMLMGWLDPYPVDPGLGATWTLFPSEQPDHPLAAAKIDLTGSEYFLLEYRLQDPDGNRIFSFAGDLNDNNVPDFYDISNSRTYDGGGVPNGFFDAADGDVRERLVGAEWDFFLSDNTARAPGVKGAGSGIYIWHIDEGVIRDAFGRRQNLFNADPRRKAVDLEEADGIQDLDSREPSPYWLGGDDDSFRGEGAAVFGPDTRPDTRTNGGVRTGLVIDQISTVVLDSPYVYHVGTDSTYAGIRYRESMTFRCRREDAGDAEIQLLAAKDLDGVDMTGSHLLVATLDGDFDNGVPVFVAAADSGRVYAWTADLAEWVDQDDDSETFRPLAVGTDELGAFVTWLPPAAAGQFDPTTSELEIVLSSAAGLYAFRADGTPLASGSGETDWGRVAALEILLPPVLVPLDISGQLDAAVIACVVSPGPEPNPTANQLRFFNHHGDEVAPAVSLPGRATAPPVRLGGILFTTIETTDNKGVLVATTYGEKASVLWQAPLDLVPGSQPPLVASNATATDGVAADPLSPATAVIVVTSAAGRGQTIVVSSLGAEVHPLWPIDLVATSPLGPGGAYTGADLLGRVSASGALWTGWPRRPAPAVQASGAQPLALFARQSAGFSADSYHHLFSTRDGRLYLTGPRGEIAPGWPVAGPADLQATPAIVTLAQGTSDERLLFMAAGTVPQITGLANSGENEQAVLLTRAVTRLRSWEWPGAGAQLQVPAHGAMYGGSPWRGEAAGSLTDPVALQMASLAASHVCYPQPLATDVLRVRGQVRRPGSARAVILNLQGERVRDTGELPILGNMPFELEIDMRGVASGLYLCRLEANGETSVRTIAVTR
jgi:M6 family metalloprotease-like protein